MTANRLQAAARNRCQWPHILLVAFFTQMTDRISIT